MKKSIIILTSLAIIASCGEKKETKTQETINVELASTGSTIGEGFVSASGKIEAENSANLSTRMMGYVTSVNVKGQVNASIIQAQAAYNSAKKDYDRFKTLFSQQSASQKELDDMTTRYEMAKAGLEAAKEMRNEINAQFSYSNISAPFSGTVTNTFVKEGDMANPGMPLVSVEGGGRLQVMAMVSENVISYIKVGMPVKVDIKSMDKLVEGNVAEVSLSAKNTGGQYLVKINLKAIDKQILSGMFVNVQFPVASNEMIKNQEQASIWVPETALVKEGQLTGVYALGHENTAILRWVRLGKKSNGLVEILSGLSAGEQYITKANGKLYNGVKVKF
jgi:RND family efflux transporter MFP subunit